MLTHNVSGQSVDIEKYIDTYVKNHNFDGTILTAQSDKITFQHSFGIANRPFNVPVTNETKFKIASVTKAFTAVLILQLYEQGKIDLNSVIKTYLPDYTGEGAGKVTIHQLLNHTSGIANMDTITSIESALKNGIPQYQQPYTTIILSNTDLTNMDDFVWDLGKEIIK
jgi:CubicO group peptidase (beta-lactamase class C family)